MSVQTHIRVLSAAALILLMLGGAAHAAEIAVNSTADTADAVPGDGTCGTGLPGNSCTLRAAIEEANGTAEADTINLDAVAGATLSVLTDYPEIIAPVAINGPADRPTVDGSDVASLFRFSCSADCTNSPGAYSISNLIIQNGRTTSTFGGGGIYFGVQGAASLGLTDVDVSGSTATAGPGGGIALNLLISGSSATMTRVTLDANTAEGASGNGGGLSVRIAATGSATIEDSSITGNASDAADGGGVSVKRGRLSIYRSTISGNTASDTGGGIYLDTEGANGGSVWLEHTTISGNTATSGGGIGALSTNPAASAVTFTTLTGNTGGGLLGQADPIVTFPGNLSNPFTSNLVGNNAGGNCAAALAHNDTSNSGYNLTDDSSCGFSADNNDQIVVDAAALKLATLAENPGSPETHALQAGSPAIDAGNPNWDTGSDQRGATTQDGGADGTPGDGTPVRDVGAYEFGGFGLVQFAFSTFEVGEENSPAAILIKRYGVGTAASSTPTVAFSTDSAGATATDGTCGSGGADYTAVSPTNFAFTGEIAPLTQFDQTANVTICPDVVVEGDEVFNIVLAKAAGGDPVGYDLGPQATGTATIQDVENGAFQFDNAAAHEASEGDGGSSGSITLTVSRINGSDGAVRVSYMTTSTCTPACTATANTDYTAVASFVDFADAETSRTLTIDFVGDAAFEGNETFETVLTGVSCQNLAPGQTCDARRVGADDDAPENRARVTINNDDTAVPGAFQFELGSYTAMEATGELVVTVKRVGGSDGEVSVDYAATDGTATQDPGADQDFFLDPLGTTLTWASGDAADKTFTVTLVPDAARESNKDFTLTLGNPTGGAGGETPTLGTPGTAAVTLISDLQPRFQFSVANGQYSPAENAGQVELTVTWDEFTGQDVTLPYFTQDGTAVSPADYTGVPQVMPNSWTITSADATSRNISIPVTADSSAEGNETFLVHLGTPTGGAQTAGTNPATVTIVDPAAVRFTAATFTRANEVNGGSITVSVERIGDTTKALTVDLTISQNCSNPPGAGCAEESVDYTRAAGFTETLSWDADETGSKPFTFTVIGDTLIEGDESIKLDLSNPSHGPGDPAALGNPSTATAIIPDDDYRFEIVDVSPLLVAEADGSATITVRRFGSTIGAASVDYATADGTALAGDDYTQTASPPALSWSAGEGGTKTVAVPLAADGLDEVSETFSLALSAASNNAIGEATPIAGSPLTVQVADSDPAPGVTLSLAGSPLAENGGVATVTATLSAVSSRDVTVNLAYAGTAAGADYTASSASILITAGTLAGTATITGMDDALNEASETVTVDISTVTHGTETGTQQVVASIADDDTAPSVSLALASSPLAENGGVATVTATLSAASGQDVTVNLAYGGTASGTDYVTSTAGIVIAAGSLTGTATITGSNDALDEFNETVSVDIASVDNGTESGTQQVVATITDDDAAPSVTLSASASMPETGGTATATATLSAVSGRAVTVNLGFAGTAAMPADYTASATSITIAAGSLTGSITLTSAGDANDETDETVIVNVTSVTNGTESGTQTRTVTIIDDDATPSSGGGAWDLLSLWLLLPALRRRRIAAR